MDEKKIISLSNDIVSAIVDFSMGKGKIISKVPRTVANKLANDEDLFEKVKQCYVEYLATVDNKMDEAHEVKRLTDFRYRLVEIYTATESESQIDSNSEIPEE